MPEFTSYAAGTPSWVDHATKDLATSNAFYKALFGWEADDQGEEMGHYTLMRKGGKTVAGSMLAMDEDQPSTWVTYVSVDSADAPSSWRRRRAPWSSSSRWMCRT